MDDTCRDRTPGERLAYLEGIRAAREAIAETENLVLLQCYRAERSAVRKSFKSIDDALEEAIDGLELIEKELTK